MLTCPVARPIHLLGILVGLGDNTMRPCTTLVLLIAALAVAACGPGPSQESKAQKPGDSAATGDANAPLGQLGTVVVPTHYALDLSIRPDQPRYAGMVKIDVTLSDPRKTIYLHGKDLNVTSVKAQLADGTNIAGTYSQVHPTGVARLTFPREIPSGPATLILIFDAPFNDTPNGLTRQLDSGEQYAWTQFEAISARRAFPCFDEPGFKTPFDITITARATDAVISNTMPATDVVLSGVKRVTFAPTAPLPTYLIEMAVGPYDVVEGAPIPKSKWRDQPLPLRGVTVKGKGPQIAYALANTAPIVTALETYFGRPFPFPKLDLIAPPNFAAGGMENAGAITYAERSILLDEHASLEQKRAFNLIHAHELSHQWFGDLVTPKWWNDIWLNESFATWMGDKTAAKLFPRGEYERETLRDAMEVMDEDALASARSVRQEIKDTGDIFNAFDGLTYKKGGAVLSMFESFLGTDKFRDGVRHHLDRFANGVADVHDFMTSLAEGSKHPELVPAIESFLNQPGVPLVRMHATCEGKKTSIELSQSPYGRSTDKDTRLWHVPVCLHELTGNTSTCVMLDQPTVKLALITRCSNLWMPNSGGTGYYRFAVSAEDWTALLSHLNLLTPPEQISTMHSLRAAFRAGEVDGAMYADALERMATSGAWDVLELAGKFLTEVRADLLDVKAVPAFRARLRSQLTRRIAQVGWAPKPKEPAATTLLRAALADILVKQAQDAATISTLAAQGGTYLQTATAAAAPYVLTPELRPAALWAAVNSGGAQAARDVVAAIKASSDQQFRTDAAIALTAVRSPEAIKVADDFIVSGALRLREGRSYMRAIFADPERRAAALDWLKANFAALAAPIPAEGRARFVAYGETLCSLEQRQSIADFFKPRVAQMVGSTRVLSNTLEAIDRCIAWHNAQGSDITAYYRPK